MKVTLRLPELPAQAILDEQDQSLITLIQTGLPLSATPYADLGKQLGMDEYEVIERLKRLTSENIIKRFGVVVRHHELGYHANAMTVWNIPDEIVSELGSCMGQFEFVTLCYRRPRRLPEWPYNLFTMIHGQDRDDVLANIRLLIERCGLDAIEHDVLFSTRRFKQRGAIYHKTNTIHAAS
ncbi:AsnC family transcriptional regulator [Sulfuriflexus mobilis]|uniref:siroheme decarboxylase subunit beta n=1 Tax=Sulfuriflexus mobilis TaxID=1811807 RepID=UPI000F84E43F|nr:AsnC family transcriptional regulator [Sulfuriflexus mobilis]